MIDAIKKIGEYSIKKNHINSEESGGFLEIFCQDIQGQSPKPPRILTIDLENKDNQIRFIRVSEEEYSILKISRYLYRFGSSAGTNLTPTSIVTEIEKTYPNKIKGWFEQDFTKIPYFLEEKDLHYLKSIKDCLDINEPVIIDQIKTFLRDIRLKRESALITLVVLEHNQRQYLGDIELFQSLFIKKTRTSLYQKYHMESRGLNQVCSVCREKKKKCMVLFQPIIFTRLLNQEWFPGDSTGYKPGKIIRFAMVAQSHWSVGKNTWIRFPTSGCTGLITMLFPNPFPEGILKSLIPWKPFAPEVTGLTWINTILH